MRILLIIPDYGDGIEVGTEIRKISQRHTTTVLTDEQVTYDNITSVAQEGYFDIVHFQGHMVQEIDSLSSVLLGDGTELDLSQMATIARMASAKVIFLNSCLGARFAAYLVKHGADAAVFSTVAIPVEKAWQVSTDFYEQLRRIEKTGKQISLLDIRHAFDEVSNGQGLYGWADSGAGYMNAAWPTKYIILHGALTASAIIASVIALWAG